MTITEERSFGIQQGVIINLILNQAGTREKALMENIMNSIDAQATSVNLTIDAYGYTNTDNGRGFRTVAEVRDYFERFAFDHDSDSLQGQRTYGMFGIGRAQQWKYARCTYRSHTFQMDTDFRERQLEYLFTQDLPHQPGTVITGEWYEPLNRGELAQLIGNLSRMVAYSAVPVVINGVTVSRDPSGEEWTEITDDAFLRVNDLGELRVYNMGMLVTTISAYRHGVGGVLVSRSRLTLNTARNEVESTNPTWRKLLRRMRTLSSKEEGLNTRFSARQMHTLCQQIKEHVITSDAVKAIRVARLFRNIQGGTHTLAEFLDHVSRRGAVLVHSEQHDHACRHIHTQGLAFVLGPQTLERFETDDVPSIIAATQKYYNAAIREPYQRTADVTNLPVYTTPQEVLPDFAEDRQPKPRQELNPQEQAFVRAFNDSCRPLIENKLIAVGNSETLWFWLEEPTRTAYITGEVIAKASQSADHLMRLVVRVALAVRGNETQTEAKVARALVVDTALVAFTHEFVERYAVAAARYGLTLPDGFLFGWTGSVD